MSELNTAEAIVKSLEAEGIQYVFGVPGEENLDILEALRKSSKIRFIVTRHEQAAGFMAATIGRFTGVPGVALSTLGPGATNLVTAAAYAQLGGMPLLMISGQKPIRRSKQGAFQIIDVVDMMKPITKFSKQLVEGSLAASHVREAVRLASEERPGAALIELPEDIASEKVSIEPILPSNARRPVAEAKAISATVELLKNAKHPLIVVGSGANRKRTSNMLTQLVKGFDIPFVNTQMGKGVIDERLEQFAGTAALSEGDYVHRSIEQADVILNVGHDIVEKPPFVMNKDTRVVHINFESAVVNDIYHPRLEVIGDIANAIWQIHESLEDVRDQLDWDTTYHLETKKTLDQEFETAVTGASTITPQVLVNQVRDTLPDDGIVALDNGMYKIWFARHFVTMLENTLLLDNALATMGAGLPSAIAAKLVEPDKKVVAVVGDGGFMMNSQELETAIRLELDLTVLILNDSSFQMIRWKQEAQGLDDFGLQFNNPNFVDYAKSYGAKAVAVTTPDELESELTRAVNDKGVHVIDVQFDYSKNAESLKTN